MLHQWQVWAALCGADEQLLEPLFRQRCFDVMAAAQTRCSGFQHEVGSELAKLLSGMEEEFVDEATGYSLDFALPASRLAVEVDGPWHYYQQLGEHVPTAKTMLKKRLLTQAGWRVVTVPYYEWKYHLSSAARLEYLKGALCAA